MYQSPKQFAESTFEELITSILISANLSDQAAQSIYQKINTQEQYNVVVEFLVLKSDAVKVLKRTILLWNTQLSKVVR